MRYGPRDIALTDDGDWKVESGDFVMATGMNVIRDEITIRVLSGEREWFGDPNACAGLDRLIGRRLEPAVLEEGKRRIVRALTFDGLLHQADFSVFAVPGQGSEVTFYVVLHADQASPLEFVLDLNTGVRVVS